MNILVYTQLQILGALPLNPNSFFVLTQKRNQKKSRLWPLRSKKQHLMAKIFKLSRFKFCKVFGAPKTNKN
ncbi:hypothetical protein DDZ16_05310 [Marinilabilia rubra]|uniref:Uncharacterized protein n=1 Tax=Marinilabilia rubra TaxID=2162893 RepID=A0A2U2BBC5_9BACT|nr:hypothetical protein DDZ16_05310 [Marinilabilia rubra]